MFEKLKGYWARGYVTKETLRGWVAVEAKSPGKGITPEQYQEITGENYEEGGGDE